jgi:hypothetical protein
VASRNFPTIEQQRADSQSTFKSSVANKTIASYASIARGFHLSVESALTSTSRLLCTDHE